MLLPFYRSALTSKRISLLASHISPPHIRVMSTTIPKTMKGVRISRTGGTEVLEYHTDLPVPQPKDEEILVKNNYIGINYIDTYFRTGLYPSPLPLVLGREAESNIVSLGPTSNNYGLAEGDHVVWMATESYAEYSAIPASAAVKIPNSIPPTHACASILQGLTALTLVREAHKVEKGDWILVHAAAGGVGLWLCQMLKDIGARTIGTASTEAKRELAKKNGAEHVLDSAGDWKGEVLKLTAEEGVAAVFDGVGKSTFDDSLACVRRKGSIISFGSASGAVPPFLISRLTAKNARLMRPTLFNFLATREELEYYSNELFRMMTVDKMNVQIHEIYPLEDVARAHADIEGRKTTGKLLLKP